MALWYNLKLDSVIGPASSFMFIVVWVLRIILCLPISFMIVLSIYFKNAVGILMAIEWNLCIVSANIAIFMLLILPIHRDVIP